MSNLNWLQLITLYCISFMAGMLVARIFLYYRATGIVKRYVDWLKNRKK